MSRALRAAVELLAGDLGRRHPPRLAHHAEGCPGTKRHAQAVAGVRRDRRRARHRATQERLTRLSVPLEPARREDHGAGVYLGSGARFETDAGNATVVPR